MNDKQKSADILISPGQLPVFSIAQAIHTTYNTAIMRIVNALSLGNFEPIDTFLYRVFLSDLLTGEICCIVQRGSDKYEPAGLPFEVFVSLVAILQIKTFQATYAGGDADGGATFYISSDGIISRIEAMFMDRVEFQLWDVMCKGGEEDGSSKEAQEED